MKKLFTVLTILAAALLTAADYYQLPKVKLIHDGWGLQYQGLAQGAKPDRKYVMTTQYIKDNVELLEKSFPGSGIIIRFTTDAAKCEGTPVNINAIFGGKKIKYEYFKDDIENLKSTKFKKLTDNFIGLTVSPGNVDWFDDAAWDIVCNNHKVIARVAKDSGMVGLKFDIEEYHKNTMCNSTPKRAKLSLKLMQKSVSAVRSSARLFSANFLIWKCFATGGFHLPDTKTTETVLLKRNIWLPLSSMVSTMCFPRP